MTHQLKRTIDKVYQFWHWNEELVLVQKHKLSFPDREQTIPYTSNYPAVFSFGQDELQVYDHPTIYQLSLQNLQQEVVLSLPADLSLFKRVYDYYFCFKADVNAPGKYVYQLIDASSAVIKQGVVLSQLCFQDSNTDRFIYVNYPQETTVTCVTLINDSLLWEQNFNALNLPEGEDELKLKGFPEVIDGVLVTRIENAEHTYLIGLDMQTGSLLWHTKAYFLHQYHNGCIYTFHFADNKMNFCCIHLRDGLYKEADLTQELLSHGITPTPSTGFCISEGQLYLSISYNKKVVILDLDLLKVLTVLPVDTEASWIETPQAHGNRLYVRDEQQTLHIYEKQ